FSNRHNPNTFRTSFAHVLSVSLTLLRIPPVLIAFLAFLQAYQTIRLSFLRVLLRLDSSQLRLLAVVHPQNTVNLALIVSCSYDTSTGFKSRRLLIPLSLKT